MCNLLTLARWNLALSRGNPPVLSLVLSGGTRCSVPGPVRGRVPLVLSRGYALVGPGSELVTGPWTGPCHAPPVNRQTNWKHYHPIVESITYASGNEIISTVTSTTTDRILKIFIPENSNVCLSNWWQNMISDFTFLILLTVFFKEKPNLYGFVYMHNANCRPWLLVPNDTS